MLRLQDLWELIENRYAKPESPAAETVLTSTRKNELKESPNKRQEDKPHKRSFKVGMSRLELVHTHRRSICEVVKLRGNRYFMTFVDGYSRYRRKTWIYFLKEK